ncbi:MAG: FHA domain-containing protein [Thermoplasmatota archaeon]
MAGRGGGVIEYRLVRSRLYSIAEDLRELGAPPASDAADALFGTIQKDAAPRALFERQDATPELAVVCGLERGKSLLLSRATAASTIGRDPESDLTLDWDLLISRRHAEVRIAAGPTLVDTFSRHGTFVNGVRLPGGTPHKLSPGDIVQMGRTFLVYRA